MTAPLQIQPGVALHTIVFTGRADAGDAIYAAFDDPESTYAVLRPERFAAGAQSEAEESENLLTIHTLPPGERETPEIDHIRGAKESVHIRSRGYELWWTRGNVILQCDEKLVSALLPALVEFTHYERHLHSLETEVAAAWEELEQDKALAFEVTPADLRRSAVTASRMGRALQRRIRYARLAPRLLTPGPGLSGPAASLAQELRESTRMEERSETLDGQLETFEHIYEMSSQRIGEYQAARQGHLMEWAIIWLLVAEVVLMLAQTIWRMKS